MLKCRKLPDWLTRPARCRCFLYFDEIAGMDVVDVAVNRDVLRDEGMFTDAAHVLNDAGGLIFNRVPFHKLPCIRSMAMLWI